MRSPMTMVAYRSAADTVPLPRLGFSSHLPLLVAVGLRLGSAETASLSYLLIAAYALCGHKHAIRALALSWFFTLLSPGLAPDPSAGALLRYAVLGAAALSVALRGFARSRYIHPFVLATALIGLFIVGHSVLFSAMPLVSIFKAIAWTVAMATCLSAWLELSCRQRQEMAGELFWGLVAILLASLPLAVLPVGYLRNGHGFQGILNHPQAFGPAIGLLGAWAASRLFAEPRPARWLVGLVSASILVVLLSESRTGGLAMVLGTGLAFAVAPPLSGRSLGSLLPGLRSTRVWVVLGAVIIGGIAFSPIISREVVHYITKSNREKVTGLASAYDRSRGKLVDAMLSNISHAPFTGIGFGIASDPQAMIVKRDPLLGLPVSASIEKGVAPIAVLEELGAFGALLVGTWLCCLIRRAARNGVTPLAVALTFVMLNMGESTFFSPGGFGLIGLILLGWAYSGAPRSAIAHG